MKGFVSTIDIRPQSVFGEDVKRVVTSITIDDRRDKKLTIDYKVQSVMKKLG